MYDLRETFEFCSGMDLHAFFEEQVGDPSPPGRTHVSAEACGEFIRQAMADMAVNSLPTAREVAGEMHAYTRQIYGRRDICQAIQDIPSGIFTSLGIPCP